MSLDCRSVITAVPVVLPAGLRVCWVSPAIKHGDTLVRGLMPPQVLHAPDCTIPLPDTDLNACDTHARNRLKPCQAFLAIKRGDTLARGLMPPQVLHAPVSSVSVVGFVPHLAPNPTGGGLTPHQDFLAIKTGQPGSGFTTPTGSNQPPFFRMGGHLPHYPEPRALGFSHPVQCKCAHLH